MLLNNKWNECAEKCSALQTPNRNDTQYITRAYKNRHSIL